MRHFSNRRNRRSTTVGSSTDFEQFEQALRGRPSDDGREAGGVDRKTLQLCRQVERALAMALAGECDDDVLRELAVESAEPIGGSSHLLIRLRVPASIGVSWVDILQRLEARSARLRRSVANAICRKRVPALTYLQVPDAGQQGEVRHG